MSIHFVIQRQENVIIVLEDMRKIAIMIVKCVNLVIIQKIMIMFVINVQLEQNHHNKDQHHVQIVKL